MIGDVEAGEGGVSVSDGVAGGSAEDGTGADCAGADDVPPHAVSAKTSMSARIAQSIFFKYNPLEA